MLIHGFNSHYRENQKKLFLGESLRVFANPPGQAGEDAVPGGGVEVVKMPTNRKEAEKQKSKLFEEMQEMVPEREEHQPNEETEIQEEWIRLLSHYNSIQSVINSLVSQKKNLEDPKFLAENPEFGETYRRFYQEIAPMEHWQSMNLGIDWASLQGKMEGSVVVNTRTVMRDIDDLTSRLVLARKEALKVVMDRVKRDFQRRLSHLKDQWQTETPRGYEGVKEGWVEYCDNVEKVIGELPEFDSNSRNFPESDEPTEPQASKVFGTLREWWGYLGTLEDSYELALAGASHELDVDKLTQKFERLERLKNEKITGGFNAKVNKQIEQVEAPLRDLIAELQAKADAIPDGDDGEVSAEKAARLKELEGLKSTLAELGKNKNVRAAFDLAFDSDEVLVTAQRAGKSLPLPSGLRGQIDFIRQMPFSEEEKRHMVFRLNESLDRAELEIKDAEAYYDTVLPGMLQKVRAYQLELAGKPRDPKYHLMWLPPKGTWDEMAHTISELFERSYKRDTGRKAGIFGREVFKPLEKVTNPPELLKPITEISGAMDIHREHAEIEDYQNWMKHHEHASIEHLFHRMHETNNRFEFRGVVELLAKKGRMRFYDDEGFFKQLNKWQNQVSVPVSKHWHLEKRSLSQEQLRKAINAIFQDPEVHRNWVTQNASGIESEKASKMKTLGELSEDKEGLRGKIQSILDEYLKDRKAGKHFSEADPNEYEAILDYAIAQGKLDAEDVLYFIIQGIGNGLMALERGSDYTGKNNQYPAIEIFASPTSRADRPTLEDVEEWSKMSYDHHYYWYHSYVMYLDKVQQRLQKALTQGIRLDHDYFTAFAGYATSKTLEELLRRSPQGGYTLQSTAIQNGTKGRAMTLHSLAENFDQMGVRGDRALSDFVAAEAVWNGILNDRMHRESGSEFYRADQAMKSSPPRYKFGYKQFFDAGGQTTGENLKQMSDRLKGLDFDKGMPLLRKLFNGEFSDDREAVVFARGMLQKYPGIFGDNLPPKGINDLFQYVGAYMDYVIKNHSPVVRAFMAKMKKEHRAYYATREAGGELSLPQMLAETKAKQEEYRSEIGRRAVANEFVTDPHAHHGHGGHGLHAVHGEHEHGEHEEEGMEEPANNNEGFALTA
ncbi:MAG: hypothetical protein WC924_00125 [Candidatus Gracilibacteria bacterium]